MEQHYIEQREGVDGRTYWCVMVKSPVAPSGYIVQAECLSREAAEIVAREWD